VTALDRLASLKTAFGTGREARIERLLRSLAAARLGDPRELIRLHEMALYFCAYPPNRAILRAARGILRSFGRRVRALDDLDAFEDAEASGIASTRLTAVFSYEIARHLKRRFGRLVTIDWERHDEAALLATTLPRLVPAADDDAMVEAEVPWRRWMGVASGRGELEWLLDGVARLERDERSRADRYQALRIPIRWEIGESAASRTHMRLPVHEVFYHRAPLIRRGEIDLADIPAMPPLPRRRVGRREAERMIDLARDTSAARFRELHGFTYGAPSPMYEYDAGRGVRFFLWGLMPEHRLPLRAYHAATMWKNGVPIGYFEALSLFERLEAGFNLYYTFREGETAWLYRQLLAMFHRALGVTVVWVDPYQIGHGNDEAIESGAFWFYRKLGFRPVSGAVARLLAREERRIAADRQYRSSASTLRRLVAGPMVFEMPGAERGAWDDFETRRVGMVAARVGAASLLSAIPGVARWPPEDRRLLNEITRAKRSADETRYLHLMQRHARLRRAVLSLGRKQ
jgi:hypothetical protein